MKTTVKPSPKKSFTMTKLLPISLSMLIWTSCAHYKVIDADKTVRRLQANETFKPSCNGWFVPDARCLQIREPIADKIKELENPKGGKQQKHGIWKIRSPNSENAS